MENKEEYVDVTLRVTSEHAEQLQILADYHGKEKFDQLVVKAFQDYVIKEFKKRTKVLKPKCRKAKKRKLNK